MLGVCNYQLRHPYRLPREYCVCFYSVVSLLSVFHIIRAIPTRPLPWVYASPFQIRYACPFEWVNLSHSPYLFVCLYVCMSLCSSLLFFMFISFLCSCLLECYIHRAYNLTLVRACLMLYLLYCRLVFVILRYILLMPMSVLILFFYIP